MENQPHRPIAAPSETRDPRVYLAAERTLLSWVRTGLAMMGFGFVVARFGLFLRELAAASGAAGGAGPGPARMPSGAASLFVGTALVALGVAVNAAAGLSHVRFARRFRAGQPLGVGAGGRPSMGVTVAAAVAALGAGLTLYLALAA